MATSPTDLTPPAVNIPIVDPKTGTLTQYGWQFFFALVQRTGGAGPGLDIGELKVYINQQLQDEREAPLPSLLRPPVPPEDLPSSLPALSQAEDNPSIGDVWAYVRKLESRISELEEAPQWPRNPSL